MDQESLLKIQEGKTALGIELGSTRIKAVLIDEKGKPLAAGGFEWENRLEDGVWTYSMEDAWNGVKESYAALAADVKEKYGETLTKIGAIGISGMMHGYLVFDKDDKQLVPFRTWRNRMTEQASEQLTELFDFKMPQRWSASHLYQSVLDGLEHVKDIAYITTLSGYVHWKLTGQKVLGIDDASGMFPVDMLTNDYDQGMVDKFDALLAEKGVQLKMRDVFPKVLVAGDHAGCLSEEGARLLDASGKLQAGIPMCPPAGDVGTGMVATNSIGPGRGNVSAGTSLFAIVVLDKPLSKRYPLLDFCNSPAGLLAANMHGNNGTTDLNAWIGLFREFAEKMGMSIDTGKLFETMFKASLEGDNDCGGLLSLAFPAGEGIVQLNEGRPVFARKTGSRFTLANFMRSHLYSAIAPLRMGLDMLREEGTDIKSFTAHGGMFKTEGVGQKFLAGAFEAPVTVMETAGEGGAWGVALLAAYLMEPDKKGLQEFLDDVFAQSKSSTMQYDPQDTKGFNEYLEDYKKGISIEREAIRVLD